MSLVVAPLHSEGATTEVRTVQFGSLASPSALLSGALEQVLISSRAQTGAPVALVVTRGVANSTNAPATTALTFDSAMDPATDPQQVNNAALAETPTGTDLGSILGSLINNPIVGPIVLFGPLFLLLIPALPILLPAAALFYVQEAISYLINSLAPPPVAAPASTAMVEAKATLTNDQLLSDSAPVTTTTVGPAERAAAAEPGKAEVSPAVALTEPTSEIADTSEESTGPTVDDPEPSAAKPKPAKPSVPPTTHRPVVRSLVGVGERARDLLNRGNGGHRPTRNAEANEGTPTAGPFSGDDSSDGDADDS